MVRFLSLIPLALVLSCTPKEESLSGDEQALRLAVAQYYLDMSSRNWEAYASHFWPHATLATVWQPPGEDTPRVVVTSIEEFLEHTDEGPDSKPIFEERLLSQEVRVLNNLAHVWAHYEARFGDSTSVFTWRGYDAFTWMKHDSTWRIVALAYTDEPGEKRAAP